MIKFSNSVFTFYNKILFMCWLNRWFAFFKAIIAVNIKSERNLGMDQIETSTKIKIYFLILISVNFLFYLRLAQFFQSICIESSLLYNLTPKKKWINTFSLVYNSNKPVCVIYIDILQINFSKEWWISCVNSIKSDIATFDYIRRYFCVGLNGKTTKMPWHWFILACNILNGYF